MQLAWSRIWTRVVVSISYDDNHYTTGTSMKFFSCVRGELETEHNCNILTHTLMAITAFLSRSPGLLNRGPGGPASLWHGPHSSIFSPTNLNFLSSGLYNNLTPTLLPASVTISHSILPLDSQGHPWSPDIFDWMHLLFTRVHFFFWQLDRVGGQYATLKTIWHQVWILNTYIFKKLIGLNGTLKTTTFPGQSEPRSITTKGYSTLSRSPPSPSDAV